MYNCSTLKNLHIPAAIVDFFLEGKLRTDQTGAWNLAKDQKVLQAAGRPREEHPVE